MNSNLTYHFYYRTWRDDATNEIVQPSLKFVEIDYLPHGCNRAAVDDEGNVWFGYEHIEGVGRYYADDVIKMSTSDDTHPSWITHVLDHLTGAQRFAIK